MSLTQRIVTAMILGLLVGALFNFLSSGDLAPAGLVSWLNLYLVDGLFDTVGQIFVRSLKLLVVPLVITNNRRKPRNSFAMDGCIQGIKHAPTKMDLSISQVG